MQVLSLRGNPFRSTPRFDWEATGWTLSATARLLAQPTKRAQEIYSQLHPAGWLHVAKLMVGTMPRREIRSVKGWAGVLLTTNLGIQSGPHLPAEGNSDDQPTESNSSQTSTGCGILTQWIPSFETETESRAAPAPAAAPPPPLQLLPACNLP